MQAKYTCKTRDIDIDAFREMCVRICQNTFIYPNMQEYV